MKYASRFSFFGTPTRVALLCGLALQTSPDLAIAAPSPADARQPTTNRAPARAAVNPRTRQPAAPRNNATNSRAPRANTSNSTSPTTGTPVEPVNTNTQAGQVATCLPPTQQQCLSSSYLGSKCGIERFDDCKGHVAESFRDRHKTMPKNKMLRPNRSNIPADITDAALRSYNGPPKRNNPVDKTVLYPGGKFEHVPVAANISINPNTAATAHRNPAWDQNGSNGQGVGNCTEYGYEQIYDLGRFIDAAAACRGDGECVFQVAYRSNTPGIANRVLQRKDGTPIAKQFTLPKGKFPKNELFGIGSMPSGNLMVKDLLYANGGDEGKVLGEIAPIPALEQALVQGMNYYEVGLCASCNGPRFFKSAWDWHKSLHDRTVNVTRAEREEYVRRFQRFRELVHLWGGVVHDELAKIGGMVPYHEFVLPYDMVTNSYFDRINVMNQMRTQVDAIHRAFTQKHGSLRGRNHLPINQLMRQQRGELPPRGVSATAGLMAAPTPRTAPTGATPRSSAARPPRATTTTNQAGSASTAQASAVSVADFPIAANLVSDAYMLSDERRDMIACDKARGPEFAFGGPLSCKIGVFLRYEWKRKDAGQKSCLDLGHVDCDWRPEMFDDEFLAQVPGLDVQVKHEQFCRDYTSNGTFSPIANNLTQATTILNNNKQAIETAWRELAPYYDKATTSKVRLRGESSNTERAGDRRYFAADLGYRLGWEVAAKQKTAAGEVCRLEGGVDGKTDFAVHVLSNKINVISANLGAEANLGVNSGMRQRAWLELFDKTVVGKKAWSSSSVTETAPMLGGQIPQGPKPSVTVTVGPVPVTMSAWGDLFVGIMATGSGDGPSSCNPNELGFGVRGTFGPTVLAGAKAQAGVGVPGASVGVRVALNLLTLKLPASAGLKVQMVQNGNQSIPSLFFDAKLNLTLATLSGYLALYFEILFASEEVRLLEWRGLGPVTIPLLPELKTEIPVFALRAPPMGAQ